MGVGGAVVFGRKKGAAKDGCEVGDGFTLPIETKLARQTDRTELCPKPNRQNTGRESVTIYCMCRYRAGSV